MKRLLISIIAIAVLAAAMPSVGPVGLVAQAQAQQKKETRNRPNLFELLFGGALRKQREQVQKTRKNEKARRVIVKSDRGASSVVTTQAPVKQVVEKSENALKILVAGDFMADGLSDGLQQAYAENPNVVLVNAAVSLSGLVRDDVVNWPQRIGELVEEHRPVAVIFLAGMNDRQQMRTSAGRVAKLSDAWKSEYDSRVAGIVKAVRERNLPLFWVGLPPVNSSSMNSDYLVFNEVYRNKTEGAGGKFIDIWDGYTNAEGNFVSAGPDVSGQIVRLRNSDGINMTRAGKAKLAFYAERELRKVPGLANISATSEAPGLGRLSAPLEPEYDPAATGRTIVVSLDAPEGVAGETLEGGSDFLAGRDDKGKGTSHALVVDGLAFTPHAGRVDSGWGLPQTAKAEDDGIEQKPVADSNPKKPVEPASAASAAN
ncbi:MAG: DUF459 domain-containing protein [Nitratireductor sp.]|nr:DUF459 domain-containing protein [Nitratireductor sp.]